ncbi:MAG: hypothetical protein HXY22_08890 [Alphaproteobacteria bacterium]|nr:hypothetical protein [Alphaproteobacteria bacterium]
MVVVLRILRMILGLVAAILGGFITLNYVQGYEALLHFEGATWQIALHYVRFGATFLLPWAVLLFCLWPRLWWLFVSLCLFVVVSNLILSPEAFLAHLRALQ